MAFQSIILKKEEGIATIILNRPERGNALNLQMFDELVAALDKVARDKEVRVLVLTGAGRGFCGGGDMSDVGEGGSLTQMGAENVRQFIRRSVQTVTLGLQRLEVPTIAMVNGFAVGGGFDWACACDIRMGSENTRFANAFARVGLIPETGGCHLLPRIIGRGKALEILYTGRWVEAKEAERLGLLDRLVPAGELEKETMALARQLAKAPPISTKMTKNLVDKGLETDLETALEMAAACQAITLASEDHREGVAAWREKREPVYQGK